MHVQELRDHIISFLPAFSAKTAADVLYSKRTTNQRQHELLWRAIFKDENWLQLAVDVYKVNPVLVGPDLHNKAKKPQYAYLLAGDLDGDLRWERDKRTGRAKFFQSLQKHEYNQAAKELTFDCGIVLNITQVIAGCDEIQIKDLRVLFSKKELKSTYCFWNDDRIRHLKRPDIRGIGGEVTRLEDISHVCCLNLHLPGQLVQQEVFEEPNAPRLNPIRNGERCSTGEPQIQHWIHG